jgi:hypothetical protein
LNLKETLYNINRTKESFFNIDKGKFINYDVLRNGILVYNKFCNYFKYKNDFNHNDILNITRRRMDYIWIYNDPKTTIPVNEDVNLSYKGYFTK